jgi:hypothetical protein
MPNVQQPEMRRSEQDPLVTDSVEDSVSGAALGQPLAGGPGAQLQLVPGVLVVVGGVQVDRRPGPGRPPLVQRAEEGQLHRISFEVGSSDGEDGCMSERSFAVFDVDGVVADVRHRLRHVAGRPKNWAAFFAAAGRDPLLPTGAELARGYAEEHRLVWLTGRPERLRGVTERWLAGHGLPVERLLMRPAHDRRPARLYKAERLRRLAGDGRIAVVVDDDPAVVAELTGAGWPVRLADWVPYAESLRQAQELHGRT